MLIIALFTLAKIWKPIDRWVDKKPWYIYTMEYYSGIKKNEILPFVTAWMYVEGIMLNEVSQGNINTT